MDKTLYCGIDLHGKNGMYVIADQEDGPRSKKRLPNVLSVALSCLEPFRQRLEVVAVESAYNWYWLVDGLQAHGYPVVPANPAKIDQYDGIKQADDLTDTAFLARLALSALRHEHRTAKQDAPTESKPLQILRA